MAAPANAMTRTVTSHFCSGPLGVNPFRADPVAGVSLLFGVSAMAADVPEVTEEEHRRSGDLADAMMQEFKRVIAEKIRT
jgi:hypothetical protein